MVNFDELENSAKRKKDSSELDLINSLNFDNYSTSNTLFTFAKDGRVVHIVFKQLIDLGQLQQHNLKLCKN